MDNMLYHLLLLDRTLDIWQPCEIGGISTELTFCENLLLSAVKNKLEIVNLKILTLALLSVLFILTIPHITPKVSGVDDIDAVAVEENHIIELNSDQPYVAGFHVNMEDFSVYEVVDATAITVSFQSVETGDFPGQAWLGAGMFVQAQDSRFLHVDYGFYMMLVRDDSGNLFVDLGLHQTREFSLPIQMPPSEVVYANTWQLLTSDPSISVNLLARWDKKGSVHYSVSTDQINITLMSIAVLDLPNCQNIIHKFYAGNVIVNPFPLSRYVNYFQFGVVGSETVADTHWVVSLRNPRMLRKNGWVTVDKAWTLQGDKSYLDSDWMWGGKPYYGVDAQASYDPSEGFAVLFSYTGYTLKPGTVLWNGSNPTPTNEPALRTEFYALCFATSTIFSMIALQLKLSRLRIVRAKSD